MLAHQFFRKGGLRSYENLASLSQTNKFPFWTYRQLRHFPTAKDPTTTWCRQLSPFEALCSRNAPQRHLISYIYTLLQDEPCQTKTIPSHSSWEKDLHMTLTKEHWEDIYTYAHKGSMNVAIQENGYKIATKWYRIPARLHKFSPTIPNICWRCKKEEGSMIHVWWECPLIRPFWQEVHTTISQVTTYALNYYPAQYLLHHTTLPKQAYYN